MNFNALNNQRLNHGLRHKLLLAVHSSTRPVSYSHGGWTGASIEKRLMQEKIT